MLCTLIACAENTRQQWSADLVAGAVATCEEEHALRDSLNHAGCAGLTRVW